MKSIVTFAVSRTVYEKFDVKQSNDLAWNVAEVIDSRIIWKLSCDFLLAISVSVDVSYIISEMLDVGITT